MKYPNYCWGLMVVAWGMVWSGLVWGASPANCYEVAKIPVEKQVFTTSTVALLDETVVFDKTQQEHIRRHLEALLENGNEIHVFTFSAFRDGRYTRPVVSARLVGSLDEATRYTMRKDSVRNFETCQQVSMIQVKKQLDTALATYFQVASTKLESSDVLGTLRQVGDAVLPDLKSKNRRLLLVSDMFENSSVTSFYGQGGTPRAIDVAVEFKKVNQLGFLADFRGAKVYVIGAGVAPAVNNSASTYRAHTVMGPLKSFWTLYFEKSNAKLVEFGQPLLLSPIGGIN